MEGLLDFTLRDVLTSVGGIDRCVAEFIRVTNTLLPERVFTRIVPELNHGGRTRALTVVRRILYEFDQAIGGQFVDERLYVLPRHVARERADARKCE